MLSFYRKKKNLDYILNIFTSFHLPVTYKHDGLYVFEGSAAALLE